MVIWIMYIMIMCILIWNNVPKYSKLERLNIHEDKAKIHSANVKFELTKTKPDVFHLRHAYKPWIYYGATNSEQLTRSLVLDSFCPHKS